MQPPTVTNKQTEILLLLYRFRFLNRQQIQTLLSHKYHSRIRSWLSKLTDKGVLARTYSRKLGENTKPAVYFLDNKSRSILKEQKNINLDLLNRIYREKTRSPYFRDQSMFLADIFMNLQKAVKETKGKIHLFTKTDLEDHKYLPQPLPNAYIAWEENNEIRRYFQEMVSPQVPRYALRSRIKDLIEYYFSNEWLENTKHPFPKILMICPSYVTKGFLSKFIVKELDSEGANISFYLTTIDQIKSRGIKPDIWQKVE
ncbi:MAG: replication-relaxation family protein [Candidatus Woykebacteria bacterium]